MLRWMRGDLLAERRRTAVLSDILSYIHFIIGKGAIDGWDVKKYLAYWATVSLYWQVEKSVVKNCKVYTVPIMSHAMLSNLERCYGWVKRRPDAIGHPEDVQ
jgi:hypothetical protein